jgi:hypothetical protein
MSLLYYWDGAVRESETLCAHCRGDCCCSDYRKVDVNASPGCRAGTCCCPAEGCIKPKTGDPADHGPEVR